MKDFSTDHSIATVRASDSTHQGSARRRLSRAATVAEQQAISPRQRIDAEAADWVIRLSEGEPSPRTRKALVRWLAADMTHQEAFSRARLTWHTLGMLKDEPGDLLDDLVWEARRPPRRFQLASIAACLCVLLVATGFWTGDLNPAYWGADYRTRHGERMLVALPDNSQVELGPASALRVEYSAQDRHLVLLSGEAVFSAVPRSSEEPRVFSVQAANGTTSALGTRFAVTHQSNQVQVAVLEHEVAVDVPGAPAAGVKVSPGQAVSYRADNHITVLQDVNLRQQLAWQRDRLFFDEAPLADVVATLNRYRRGRIVVGSDSLAQLRVSGVFDTRELDSALKLIASELDARLVSLPLVTVLY